MTENHSSFNSQKVSKNGKPIGRPSYASQGKPKKTDTQRAYKVVVPNGDCSVIEWMDMQDDPSVSIRLLVKDYISRKGFQDIACTPAEYSPVGRKSLAAREAGKPEDERFLEETEAEPRTPSAAHEPKEDDDAMSSFFGNKRQGTN